MRPVLTAAETQALDRETEARGIPVENLMERAGLAVARAAMALAGGAYGRRAVAVCGKGNNGGDGLVAARFLSRAGMAVDVFLLADPADLRGPAAVNLDRLRHTGITPRRFSRAAVDRSLARADVAVDAIVGTGFRGSPEAPYAEAIEALNEGGAPVVAVDIPSGVEGDTGAARGPAVWAEATVALGAPKVGDVLFPGAERAGVLEVADIGFPPDLLRADVVLVEADDARSLLPLRPPQTNKRRTGVVLVVAGSRRFTGAARLVAAGAYRAGAGLVTVAAPESVLPTVQAGMAEATFLPLPEGPAGSASEQAWEVVAETIDRFDAVAMGPGLSTDEETPAFVRRLVAESPVPVVADADAVNAFAGQAGDLARRRSPAVVTPHAGEFARLFGMPAGEVEEDRLGFARKAASETGCVVLLKGPRTVVAIPEGDVRINPTGSPALATGGTGDVLTGAIGAYLARGLAAADAATLGAFVHGLAGELVGERRGDGGTAMDVAAALPEAAGRLRGSA
ncbi:MAG TPA: NAD(P)H-hydrate dehydratase [Actinomycetota bacterium]|nr:NAD(P)H-hydrate dehydratase [Actinomycetota bacterium]